MTPRGKLVNDEVEYLTISQVCRRIPGARANVQINPSTVTRWILRGARGLAGHRIKLPAIRAGGRWLLRPADIDAFFASLSNRDLSAEEVPRPLDLAGRHRKSNAEAAAAEMSRRGA